MSSHEPCRPPALQNPRCRSDTPRRDDRRRTSAGDEFHYLEVRASNRATRVLYERFGFRTVGIRKNYYAAPPEDGLIMMLDLRRTPAD
ncbi:MAG: hypothetical protein MZV70_44960 [Desulfobacterales bacterium]|nr:hypothetical protein [Desulfobacterales bacterium]